MDRRRGGKEEGMKEEGEYMRRGRTKGEEDRRKRDSRRGEL